MDTSLTAKLTAALAARDDDLKRRRMPETDTARSSTSTLIDFSSSDYLSLATSQRLRNLYLQKLNDAPDILGAGGSRTAVNSKAHDDLEERVKKIFRSEGALIFNSGCTANIGFFACIPQVGDVIVHDESIHASVYDGMRASRIRDTGLVPFSHNSLFVLHAILAKLLEDRPGLRSGTNSVFVAVESLYSMDGSFAPLLEIVNLLESLFPKQNAYLVVDEAHCTGVYGDNGRGRVAELGLESKVFARIHTFSKVLVASGGVVLSSSLVCDYLYNYARSLIYTGALTYSAVIAIDCGLDFLEDGTVNKLSAHLLGVSSHLISFLGPRLASIPAEILSLPPHFAHPDNSSPPSLIIPLLTPFPWSLTTYLRTLGMHVSAVTPPIVPIGKTRVRICLHAGNTKEDVEKLAIGAVRWAEETLVKQQNEKGGHRGRVSKVTRVQNKL